MIPEKMLELLIMRDIDKSLAEERSYREWFKETHDIDKFYKRYQELGKEFLEPYMKTSTSKED